MSVAVEFVWDPADLAKLRRACSDRRSKIGQMCHIAVEPVERFATQWLAPTVIRHAQAEAPTDTKRLVQSLRVQWSGQAGMAIVSGVPYVGWVLSGTPPHWPPMAAVAGWAQRHGIPPFLVARAISKKGTKANPFFDRAWERTVAGMPGRLSELMRDIQRNWSAP
jgi:hypothetical protein